MKTKLMITALMASLLAFVNGCVLFAVGAVAAGGAAGYAYVDGEEKATVGSSIDRTWSATLGAMKDLEFPVTSQAKDSLEANLTARNASNTEIKIRLKNISPTATEIRVRVGTFGDEPLSRTILDKINARLTPGS